MTPCAPDPLSGNTDGVPVDWPPTTKWPPLIPDPQHVDNPATNRQGDDWADARYDAANTNTKAPEHPLATVGERHQMCYWPQIDAHQSGRVW